MAERIQSSFGLEARGGREIVARFDGGTNRSEGGAFPPRQAGKRLNPLGRPEECVLGGGDRNLVEDSVPETLSRRMRGRALG